MIRKVRLFFINVFSLKRSVHLLINRIPVLLAIVCFYGCTNTTTETLKQPSVESRVSRVLLDNGLRFRDLNKNGRIDRYEDWRISPEDRVADLLTRMTIEEKIGQLFTYRIDMFEVDPTMDDTSADILYSGNKNKTDGYQAVLTNVNRKKLEWLVKDLHVGQLKNVTNSSTPSEWARQADWHNKVQEYAERQRLGIPILFYSWSGELHRLSMLPFGTTRDTELVKRWASDFAQRYRLVGIHECPIIQLGVATEPRWNRVRQVFGEDAGLCAQMTVAAMEGIQGPIPNPQGQLFYASLFPGGGPQKDGLDPHQSIGRDMVYPGGMLDYHLKPWKAAIDYGLYKVMPYYGIPNVLDTVNANFSKSTIDGLLRDKLGYNESVGSDFGTLWKPWGLDDKDIDFMLEALFNAGVDQYNDNQDAKQDGISRKVVVQKVRELVAQGKISMQRIDEAASRLLINKFRLGLFDDPYNDPETTKAIWSAPTQKNILDELQERSQILLKNNNALPLKTGATVAGNFSEEMSQGLNKAGINVLPLDNWKEADVVFLHLRRGHSTSVHNNAPLSALKWKDCNLLPELKRANKKTVVIVPLWRPYLFGPVVELADAIVVAYQNKAMPRTLTGEIPFSGKVAITLPRNQESIEKQLEDVPFDLQDPLWPYGFGMTGQEPAEPILEYRNHWLNEKGVASVEIRCKEYNVFVHVQLSNNDTIIASIPVGLKAGCWTEVRSDMRTFSFGDALNQTN